MSLATIFQFLVGRGAAIDSIARSRGALATGLCLVLVTAVARQYDQVLITEAPLRWLFGSLAFSLVSGTWIYVWAYALFARWWMTDPDLPAPRFWKGWPAFMGLFWMTAPIAWLYAVPVERFLDPVAAARTNVALLAVVSLWRVLLMVRVLAPSDPLPAGHRAGLGGFSSRLRSAGGFCHGEPLFPKPDGFHGWHEKFARGGRSSLRHVRRAARRPVRRPSRIDLFLPPHTAPPADPAPLS